jgi:hypothetical protein
MPFKKGIFCSFAYIANLKGLLLNMVFKEFLDLRFLSR